MATMQVEDLPHYTYEDYRQWEGRWEIIHGVPYAISPQPNFRHQRISQRIATQLGVQLNENKSYSATLPIDWQIDNDTVVNPDNLVVRGRPDGIKLTETPFIAFEILSPSTENKDRKLKFRLYESAGLPYYVIVDPEAREVEIYQYKGSAFVLQLKSRDETFIFEADGLHLKFDCSQVWD